MEKVKNEKVNKNRSLENIKRRRELTADYRATNENDITFNDNKSCSQTRRNKSKSDLSELTELKKKLGAL